MAEQTITVTGEAPTEAPVETKTKQPTGADTAEKQDVKLDEAAFTTKDWEAEYKVLEAKLESTKAEISSEYEKKIAELTTQISMSAMQNELAKNGVNDADLSEFAIWKYNQLEADGRADFGTWLPQYLKSRPEFSPTKTAVVEADVAEKPKTKPVTPPKADAVVSSKDSLSWEAIAKMSRSEYIAARKTILNKHK